MKQMFGIVGNPVNHSLSPLLHNYWFQKYKLDAKYSIIKADEKELSNVINKIRDKS